MSYTVSTVNTKFSEVGDMERSEILDRVERLLKAYKRGELGGEVMPEDANPNLPKDSAENYIYFTLPMALNYQRNSYTLWKGAFETYLDSDTCDVFSPCAVSQMDIGELREKLVKYKVALQPNKQIVIWKTICTSIEQFFDGDIRRLFHSCDCSVVEIKRFFAENKKAFPYLGGEKILNYWLFVMQAHTDIEFCDCKNITIAPDTHVIQSSVKLGLITRAQAEGSDVRLLTAQKWGALLDGTPHRPIDIHTPLWLWSRGKFSVDI